MATVHTPPTHHIFVGADSPRLLQRRFGSGWRGISVRRGRKWAYLSRYGKQVRITLAELDAMHPIPLIQE